MKKGDKVKFSTIHPEEGYPTEIIGTIIRDWEEINYMPKVDIKDEDGNLYTFVPKHILEENK